MGIVANADGSQVRCRTEPSLSSTTITSLSEGTQVELRGQPTGDWQPVRCAGRDGYMWAEYISPLSAMALLDLVVQDSSAQDGAQADPVNPTPEESPAAELPETTVVPSEPTLIPTEQGVTGTGYITNPDGDMVNCRAAPSTDSEVIASLVHGTAIDLRGQSENGWQAVTCGGQQGFVASQFIAAEPPPPLPEAPVATDPPVPEDEAPAEPAPEPASAPEGSNPQFGGSPLAIADAWSSDGGSSAWDAIDGDQNTAWVSASGYPSQAIITVDLGSLRSLTGVRWMYSETGGADSMRLQVSEDGQNWTQLATTSNRAPYTWEGAYTDANARFVRLVFDNPNGAIALGNVAEFQIWGTEPAAHLATDSDLASGFPTNLLANASFGTTWQFSDPQTVQRRYN